MEQSNNHSNGLVLGRKHERNETTRLSDQRILANLILY